MTANPQKPFIPEPKRVELGYATRGEGMTTKATARMIGYGIFVLIGLGLLSLGWFARGPLGLVVVAAMLTVGVLIVVAVNLIRDADLNR